MLPVGFETVIPGRERLQTHALDRAAIRKAMAYMLKYLMGSRELLLNAKAVIWKEY